MLHGAGIFTYMTGVIIRVNVGIHIPYMEHLRAILPLDRKESILPWSIIFDLAKCLSKKAELDLPIIYNRDVAVRDMNFRETMYHNMTYVVGEGAEVCT